MARLEQFIADIFDFLEEKDLNGNTNFKEIASWNSLNALIIRSNIQRKYEVELENRDFNAATRIEDLWLKVEKYRDAGK